MPRESRKKDCGCRYHESSKQRDDRCSRTTRNDYMYCGCKSKYEDKCKCYTCSNKHCSDKHRSDDNDDCNHSIDDNEKNVQNIVITIKHC